jgi:hypothetical protein
MKRFMGWVLALIGAVGVVWGGYHLLGGRSEAKVTLAQGVTINGLTGGLIGIAVLTIGLLWVRD